MDHLKNITWITVLLTLTGCVSLPDANIQKMQGPMKADEGIVVAEVINNSKIITGPLEDWNELVLWNMDSSRKDDKTFTVTALKNPSSSFLFAGRLPAGRYRVGMLYSYLVLGDTTYSARALIPPAIGAFDVEASQVTDLGTILYHSFEIRSRFQRVMPDYAITRVTNPELMTTVGRSHPGVFDAVDSAQINGWVDKDFDEDINADYALMKSSGFTQHHFPLPEGGFVTTGKLGALHHYNKTQAEKIAIPTNREISAFTVTASGEWIIGGEYGLLMKSKPPHTDWQPMQIAPSFNHIIDIASNERGMTFVLAYDGNLYKLYEYLEEASFKLHKSFINKEEFWFEDGMIPAMNLHEEGVDVIVDKTKFSLSFTDSSGWKESKVTEYLTIDKQKNGLQLTAKSGTWNWDGHGPLLVSKDQGASWQRVSQNDVTPTRTRPYIFTDRSILSVQSMDKVKLFQKINEYAKVKVLISKDQGMTFKQVGSLPKGCYTIIHNISDDDQTFVWCDNGEIYSTLDRGKKWTGIHINYQDNFRKFSKNLKIRLPDYER